MHLRHNKSRMGSFQWLGVAALSFIVGPGYGAALSAAQPRHDGNLLTLEAGTSVSVRFKATVSSADAYANQRIELEVVRDVQAGGGILIPEGSSAWGVVTAVTRRGRMSRDGSLQIRIQGVCLADGTAAALRARESRPPSRGESGAEALLALPALPAMLFLHGKDVTIPAGTQIDAELRDAIRVDSAALAAQRPVLACSDLVSAGGGTGSPRGQARSMVAVHSFPSGAEIEIDGKYVGHTPSTLWLGPGTYRLAVSKAGRKAWKRSIAVMAGGEVNVRATLEPAGPDPQAQQQEVSF